MSLTEHDRRRVNNYTDCQEGASLRIRSNKDSNWSILYDLWANLHTGHRLQFFEWPQPKEDHWANVPRYGDLLVGFYLAPSYRNHAVTVRLEIGDQRLDDVLLQPDKVTFALNEKYVVPLISLQYHKVCVQLSDPAVATHCQMVIAYLQKPLRCELVYNSWYCEFHSGSTLCISGGMAGVLGSKDTASFVARTNARPLPASIDWRIAAKREWHTKIDAELMAVAWHPKRMAYWLKDVMDDEDE